MFLPACMFGYHMCAGAYGGQKMAVDSLELELQTMISCKFVLGTEPRSSVGTESVLTDEPSMRLTNASFCFKGSSKLLA